MLPSMLVGSQRATACCTLSSTSAVLQGSTTLPTSTRPSIVRPLLEAEHTTQDGDQALVAQLTSRAHRLTVARIAADAKPQQAAQGFFKLHFEGLRQQRHADMGVSSADTNIRNRTSTTAPFRKENLAQHKEAASHRSIKGQALGRMPIHTRTKLPFMLAGQCQARGMPKTSLSP